MHSVRIGCSGWNYASWRGGEFYPPRCPPSRWLEHYAGVFDTVELNVSYYRLVKATSAARWVAQTPPGFEFAAKASRYLINVRKLRDLGQGVERFYAGLEPLVAAGRLGPVLWQLPPWFARDDEALASLAEHLRPGRHCIEFRHPSWYAPDVYSGLRSLGIALAYGDHPSRPYVELELTADWTFLRFHHGRRGRRGNYSETELRDWAARIRTLRERVDVYAYFNNDWEVFAPRNARRLRRLLNATIPG